MPTWYTVVDENDTIVWYKERREDIDPVEEFYRITALRLTNSQWEILIAQRSHNKRLAPGKRWPAVAGTVEQGESYEANIIKEMREEIWLKDVKLIIGPKYKHEWTGNNHFTQRFFGTVDMDISLFTKEEDSVEAIRRISKEELQKDIATHPENYIINMKKYVETF